jgi:putative endonuclease
MDRVTATRAQRIGDEAEAVAARLLEAAGCTILARNVRLGRDELDLVVIEPGPPDTLVVVEVRRRGRRDFGVAEETLDHRKRAAIRRALGKLLTLGILPNGVVLPRLAIRVDLIAIDSDVGGRPSVRHHRGIRL